MKRLLIIGILIIAAVIGWQLIPGRNTQNETGRKVLYYQSPMHPWIKSDKPGNCTICGMKLTPVYEGETGKADENIVTLDASSINVLNVETGVVARQKLHRMLDVAGMIDDDNSRHRIISAYVDGRIEQLNINYVGQNVNEGEVLLHFYSPPLLAARDEYLIVQRRAVSPERDRLLRSVHERLSRMGLTDAQIDALARRETHSNFIEIVAPMSGTVVKQNVYQGQYVKEGDALFEIADFSKMWFLGDVYERDLPWVKTGQRVEIATPSAPGKKFEGVIDFIDPNFDDETRSAKVRVIVENPVIDEQTGQRALAHKVYATGTIHVEGDEVLVVPNTAILMPGSEATVYVARGEAAYEPRVVTIGRRGDVVTEVVAGLNEGERVVTKGNLLIDAQSQITRGVAGGAHQHHSPAPAPASETDHSGHAGNPLQDFVNVVDKISAALAADDLNGYNAAIEKIPGATVVKQPPPQRQDTLAAARADYYPFSMAAADYLLEQLRKTPGIVNAKVYECPMVKEAVPGAPVDEGRWIQAGAPLRNPFFGKEMLECGSEVKP